MTTKPDKTRPTKEINESMELAIIELLKGASHAQAAKVAGVKRPTVTEWCNHNYTFRAELQNRRAEIWCDFREQLKETISDSIAAIRKAVKGGDVGAAKWFLERLNIDDVVNEVFSGMKEHPTTPEWLEAADAERIRLAKLDDLRNAAYKAAQMRMEAEGIDTLYDDLDGKILRKYADEYFVELKKDVSEA